MKKFILGIIVGGIIFGSSVFAVSNYFYNANEVSYIPDDNTWSVSSVSKALDDLRDKAKNYMPIPTATKSITANGSNIDVKNYAKVDVDVEGVATYLGTGKSFDVKSVRSDYESLTIDDFVVEPISGSVQQTSGGDYTGCEGVASITKTYDASTGVLSAYMTLSTDFRGQNYYWGFLKKSTSLNVKAYVIK